MKAIAGLVVVLLGLLPEAIRAAELKAGVAQVDITPPPGYRMSGYFYERFNEGAHDPLWAKGLYLEQGGVRAAIVLCDLIAVPAELVRRAREAAEEQTHVPAANILIAATHTHTGPLYYGVLRDHFHRLAVDRDGSDTHEPVDYQAELVKKLAQAVTAAQQAANAAVAAAGVTEQQNLSFNRRFRMKDGTVVFNPGKLNPNIVRPAGPIDPQVGIVLVRDAADQSPLGLLTVFPLHLDTVGGTHYSADYPYYFERELRRQLGERLVSLFGNGTCGDINHIDVTTDRRQGGQAEAERIGTTLAKTVEAALPKLAAVSAELACRSTTVDVPLQHYEPAEVEAARKNLFKVGTRELSFLEQVKAVKVVAVAERKSETAPLEVQVIRLGPEVAVVGLPGEVFVELGLAIKAASPFATTLVIELANDVPNYVPTKKAFAEGSYETVNSIVATGGGEMLVEAAVRLLKELR